jgi:hypothetical protein
MLSDLTSTTQSRSNGTQPMWRRGTPNSNPDRSSPDQRITPISFLRPIETAAPPWFPPSRAPVRWNRCFPGAKPQIESRFTIRKSRRSRGTDTYRQSRLWQRWPRDDAVPRGRSDYGEKFPPSRCRAHPVSALCVSRATTRTPRTRQSEQRGVDGAVQRRWRQWCLAKGRSVSRLVHICMRRWTR